MAKTTMDVGALRKFQEVWGPVIDAIPAVINMAESFADVERALAIKRQELDGVNAKVDAAMAAGNEQYAKLQDTISAATGKLAEVNAQIQDKQKELVESATAAKAAAAAEIAKTRADVQREIASIRSQVVEERAALDAVRAEKAAELANAKAQLEEVEKRAASAEKTLATLRAKLG